MSIGKANADDPWSTWLVVIYPAYLSNYNQANHFAIGFQTMSWARAVQLKLVSIILGLESHIAVIQIQ